MQQESIFVTPVNLCSITPSGEGVDKGRCACALVALPSQPRAKYTIVCYNTKQQTLCVARLGSTQHTQDLQLHVDASDSLTFTDDLGARWNMLLLKKDFWCELLAHVGLAYYVLAGCPLHASVVTDFTSPATLERRLGMEHEARVRFAAFHVREASSMPSKPTGSLLGLGRLIESNGLQKILGVDEASSPPAYAFSPVRSSAALHAGSRGFECSVLGMVEGGWRVIVVPHCPWKEELVVFVVWLERMTQREEQRQDLPPSVFADSGGGAALVSYSKETAVAATGSSYDGNAPPHVGLEGKQLTHRDMVVYDGGKGFTRVPACAASAPWLDAGAGIPVEHMGLIQKVAVGISSATSSARDVRDIAAMLANEWRQSVSRPKPSLLSNAMLEQHIKRAVLEDEKLKESLAQRDELIHVLDARNRELLKRVEDNALASQKLLSESKATESSTMDMRLGLSRALLKTQERISIVTQEKDDVLRQLDITKRLLATVEEELRQIRGRRDMHEVQGNTTLAKLEATQEALSAARTRRQSLECSLAALKEEVRMAAGNVRLRSSELATVKARVDRLRDHHAQSIDDERQQRMLETEQLRQDIVKEIEQREAKFRVDRARIVEDYFHRGHAEGRMVGRRNGAADVLAHQQELQLDDQRTRAIVEDHKKELRACMEAAMSTRRHMQGALELQQEARRAAALRQAQLQRSYEVIRDEASTVQSRIAGLVRGVATRLEAGVITAAQLVMVLRALRYTGESNVGFDRVNVERARRDAVASRLQWIEETAIQIYVKGAEYYLDEWRKPLAAAHAVTQAKLRVLWVAQYGQDHYQVYFGEMAERFRLVEEHAAFLHAVEHFAAAQQQERQRLWSEAQATLTVAFEAYVAAVAQVHALCEAHQQGRRQLVDAEAAGRQALCMAAMDESRLLPARFLEMLRVEWAVAQRVVMDEEEADRADVLTEECAAQSDLQFMYDRGRDTAQRQARAAQERCALSLDEALRRQALEAEEGRSTAELQEQLFAALSLQAALLAEKQRAPSTVPEVAVAPAPAELAGLLLQSLASPPPDGRATGEARLAAAGSPDSNPQADASAAHGSRKATARHTRQPAASVAALDILRETPPPLPDEENPYGVESTEEAFHEAAADPNFTSIDAPPPFDFPDSLKGSMKEQSPLTQPPIGQTRFPLLFDSLSSISDANEGHDDSEPVRRPLPRVAPIPTFQKAKQKLFAASSSSDSDRDEEK